MKSTLSIVAMVALSSAITFLGYFFFWMDSSDQKLQNATDSETSSQNLQADSLARAPNLSTADITEGGALNEIGLNDLDVQRNESDLKLTAQNKNDFGPENEIVSEQNSDAYASLVLLDEPFEPPLEDSASAEQALLPEALFEKQDPVDGSIVGGIVKLGPGRTTGEVNSGTDTDDDYSFPTMHLDHYGELTMVIPDEPLPGVSTRREIDTGTGESLVNGDSVIIKYDMFSWTTGELVESSLTDFPEGLLYNLGAPDNEIGLPTYLVESIYGRTSGSRIQVVFESGMHDLPPKFNPYDGYVLIVEILLAG